MTATVDQPSNFFSWNGIGTEIFMPSTVDDDVHRLCDIGCDVTACAFFHSEWEQGLPETCGPDTLKQVHRTCSVSSPTSADDFEMALHVDPFTNLDTAWAVSSVFEPSNGVRLATPVGPGVGLSNTSSAHAPSKRNQAVPASCESDSRVAPSPCKGSPVDKIKKKAVPWSEEEHECFLVALKRFNGDDESLAPGVADMISMTLGTRSAALVRSHAQKYFEKRRREMHKALSK
jgi:SHAQKYF class myb-like DNA-binding protein